MTQDELLRIMKSQGGQQQQTHPEKVEDLDLFIDRCMKEKDETLFSLGQGINMYLQQSQILSYVELEVYPQVMQRIQIRLNEGEE